MGKYNKLIGSIVGAVTGFGVAKGFLPDTWNTPDTVAAFTAVISAIFTWIFPANKTSQ
ncbi:MAG: hypothetical protein GY742_00860 [Hyphomicrobiales bacterium]|nr:hypothetical protein [Hyphomicrobiales bacterium]